jgi:hypothetical protein
MLPDKPWGEMTESEKAEERKALYAKHPCGEDLESPWRKCGEPSADSRSERGSDGTYYLCAEHLTKWDARVIEDRKNQQRWNRTDRNSNRFQWVCAVASIALCTYFAGPMIALLALIAGSVLYLALKASAR